MELFIEIGHKKHEFCALDTCIVLGGWMHQLFLNRRQKNKSVLLSIDTIVANSFDGKLYRNRKRSERFESANGSTVMCMKWNIYLFMSALYWSASRYCVLFPLLWARALGRTNDAIDWITKSLLGCVLK